MSDPRWTDETVELFAATLHAWATEDAGGPAYPDEDAEVQERCRDGARRFLAALADAGLLVQPGGETTEEWGIESSAGTIHAWLSRDEAETHLRVREQAGRPAGTLMSRTVYIGPWQPATQEAPHARP